MKPSETLESMERLNAKQRDAIPLLAEGLTPAEVAGRIRVQERTVSKWRERPFFMAAVNKAREQKLDELKLKGDGAITGEITAKRIAELSERAYQTLLTGVGLDRKLALELLVILKKFDGASHKTARKLIMKFGSIPNDAPPLPIQAANVIQMPKKEQA